MASSAPRPVLNVSIGVLGHVDAGKTSLVAALSTELSTAALDKHPQSRERGITLDLGFSSLTVDAPASYPEDRVQLTLVDCPGHASLIRTVIGGAQIIDMMLLVVDATKGVQTQTAECMVIGEILSEQLVVVINKVDRLEGDADKLAKLKKRLRKTFAQTAFGEDVPIVSASAKDGDVRQVVEALSAQLEARRPVRDATGPFHFAVDHCFRIMSGQGTVLTGTVLGGSVQCGQDIFFPGLGFSRKVKSMQMFKRPVERASQGDRVGICVSQLNPKLIERGIVCEPAAALTLTAVVARVKRVRFFKAPVRSKDKFHITIGHATVVASARFFRSSQVEGEGRELPFSWDAQFEDAAELEGEGECKMPQFAVLEFEHPVTCVRDSLLIGSRLDTDITSNSCRLAFSGRLVSDGAVDVSRPDERARLRVFRYKERHGVVDRVVDDRWLIGRGMFKKQTDMTIFYGLRVALEATGAVGIIRSSFGTSGKFKVEFPDGDGHGLGGTDQTGKSRIVLRFKKFVFAADDDDNKKGKKPQKLEQ